MTELHGPIGGTTGTVHSSTHLMREWQELAWAILTRAAQDARLAGKGQAIQRMEYPSQTLWAASSEVAAAVEDFSHSDIAALCCEMVNMSPQNYGYNLRVVLKGTPSRASSPQG